MGRHYPAILAARDVDKARARLPCPHHANQLSRSSLTSSSPRSGHPCRREATTGWLANTSAMDDSDEYGDELDDTEFLDAATQAEKENTTALGAPSFPPSSIKPTHTYIVKMPPKRSPGFLGNETKLLAAAFLSSTATSLCSPVSWTRRPSRWPLPSSALPPPCPRRRALAVLPPIPKTTKKMPHHWLSPHVSASTPFACSRTFPTLFRLQLDLGIRRTFSAEATLITSKIAPRTLLLPLLLTSPTPRRKLPPAKRGTSHPLPVMPTIS